MNYTSIKIDYETIVENYGEPKLSLLFDGNKQVKWLLYNGIHPLTHISGLLLKSYNYERFCNVVVGYKRKEDLANVIYNLYKNKTASELIKLINT